MKAKKERRSNRIVSKAQLGAVFCSKCGQKCTPVRTGRFDEKTGEPVYKNTCPSGICLHEGVEHAPYVGSGLLSIFGQVRCPRCGEVGRANW